MTLDASVVAPLPKGH